MKKERFVKLSNVIIIVATTAFVMTLIYGYILKQKKEIWFNALNDKESFELISEDTSPIDSIYYKKDSTFYFKNDSLIGYSVRTHKKY